MGFVGRLPFLARLASRYARRHRGQTIRAVMGLVVVAIVLTTGLGLGDSISASLERSIRTQYGPVDVVVRGAGPFNAQLADSLPDLGPVEALGVEGGATLVVVGAVSNSATKRAEAFATIRGVGPQERDRLGPLAGGVDEPRPGEVILSRSLAIRLDASIGDELTLRAPLPGLNGTLPRLVFRNASGFAGAPGVPMVSDSSATSFPVEPEALGVLALLRWDTSQFGLTVTARSPTGKTFTNSSATSPLPLRIDGPLEPGTWSIEVTGQAPIQFRLTNTIFYPPAALLSGFGLLKSRVSAIVADEGRASASFRPVALVPLADLQASMGLLGQATHGYYSTRSDPADTVHAIQAGLGNSSFEVIAMEADAVRRAQLASGNITGFLLVMGGFTMVASMLLAYALFSALVEERRLELGIARALGLTRGEVAGAMVMEGLLYAVLASAAGVLLGLLLLQGMLVGIDNVSRSEGGPAFDLYLESATIPIAFLGGLLLPLVTIAVGSIRFAALDPARAIRGAPDDLRVRRRAGLAAGLFLAALGILGVLDPITRLVGVGILAAGAALVLWLLGRRSLALATALLGVAYTAWSLYAFDDFPASAQELDPLLTMARGLVLSLVLAAVLVVSPAPYRLLGRALGNRRGIGRAAFMSLRYLAARRRAAGLTAAMIAVVSVVVTVMGTLALLFSNNISTDEGGYEVVGDSPIRLDDFPAPLPADAAAAIERTDFIANHREIQPPQVTINGQPFHARWWRTFVGVTPTFAQANEYKLTQRDDRYATDREAWDAVARGEALIAPTWYFDETDISDIQTIRIKSVLGPARDYHVAAATVDSRDGIFLGRDRVAEMNFPQGTVVYVRVREGADPDLLAARLTEEYGPEGVVFISIPQEARRAASIIAATILVFESFLALGIFVGIAATSFLATRAVHERMRDIGTMRALGYEAPEVRRAFMFESTLIAFLGLLVGMAVGLLVAHSIWIRGIRDEGVPFLLPWPVMLGFAATVLLLAALAARRPALRASRLDPAVALRHVD